MGKRIGTAIIVVLILFFVYEGIGYWINHTRNAISDAAFIRSDRLAVLSFNVGGNVILMLKKENENVKKGDLLAKIDPIDLQTAKTELQNRLVSMDAEIEAFRLQRERLSPTLRLQTLGASDERSSIAGQIVSLGREIDAARVRASKLSLDERRYKSMLESRLIAQAQYDTVHTEAVAAQKAVEGLEAQQNALKALHDKSEKGVEVGRLNQKQTAELDQKILSMEAQKKALDASLEDLEHKIGYTDIYAPFDGVIAKKYIEAPMVIKQGTPVYALTDPKALYAEVLLSERQLHGVKVGNSVSLEVDAVDNKTYHGTVESISPTSASTFSLVPRDIASGEFTKLDQRFTIRIRIENTEGLRAGMGTTVAIERR